MCAAAGNAPIRAALSQIGTTHAPRPLGCDDHNALLHMQHTRSTCTCSIRGAHAHAAFEEHMHMQQDVAFTTGAWDATWPSTMPAGQLDTWDATKPYRMPAGLDALSRAAQRRRHGSQGQSCRERTQLGVASVKSSPHSRRQGQSCRERPPLGVASVKSSPHSRRQGQSCRERTQLGVASVTSSPHSRSRGD
eukprot:366326-Chlamydomonas_euryale.AAC.5